MSKKLRKRLKRVRTRIDNDDWEYDENGRAIVDISITDADSLLSVYNSDKREALSAETAHFIDNVVKTISPKKDIHLYISCEKYTKEKEQTYKNAIINYYVNEFAEKDYKMKQNWIWSITLIIMSIIGFIGLHFIQAEGIWSVINVILDIAFWVLAWEAVDIMVFQQKLLRYDQIKDLKIIFAKISLSSLEEVEELSDGTNESLQIRKKQL